jgi:hypothetical protein
MHGCRHWGGYLVEYEPIDLLDVGMTISGKKFHIMTKTVTLMLFGLNGRLAKAEERGAEALCGWKAINTDLALRTFKVWDLKRTWGVHWRMPICAACINNLDRKQK